MSPSPNKRDIESDMHCGGPSDLSYAQYLNLDTLELLDRDFSQPYSENPKLLPVLKAIYENPKDHWRGWETCEELLDTEEAFKLWRFRPMKAVERILGYKRGTGGSTRVVFVRAALELTFFPEILSVRKEIGQ
ncbi:hypothetical protein JBE27_18265 [Streptomyces albiflaviniger]|nr:hypothetical protein [Streptomyces albiflaviniger]